MARLTRSGSGPRWIATTACIAGLVMTGCSLDWRSPGDGRASRSPVDFIDYRTNGSTLSRDHAPGRVQYPQSPPVGGKHNSVWQNCEGAVYDAPIANEHAVHSLEHGAVWVTYRPDLPQGDVDKLALLVGGKPYLFMSPYPRQDSPISLQAWGYQLRGKSASHESIARFISAYREKASLEPGAPCTGGTTATGTDLQPAPD